MKNEMVAIRVGDFHISNLLKNAFEYANESGRTYIILYQVYHKDWPLFHYYEDL